MRLRRLFVFGALIALSSSFMAPAAHAQLNGFGTVRPIPSGNVQSGTDATGEPGTSRLNVVVRGADGQVWRNTSLDGTSWIGWNPLPILPGGIKGDPTIVSWEAGRLDVFARGPDDKLWQSTRFTFSNDFGPWIKPVGDDGVLASSPDATVRGPGRLDVFVLGTDGQIYQRFWLNDRWNGGGWIAQSEPVGPTSAVGDPSAVWASPGGPNRLDLFIRGSDDKLWQRSWNGSSWTPWGQPFGLLGTLASSPDAALFDQGAVGRDQVAVFVRGTDGGIWGISTTGGFSQWVRLGQPGDVVVDAALGRDPGHASQVGLRPPRRRRRPGEDGVQQRAARRGPEDPVAPPQRLGSALSVRHG